MFEKVTIIGTGLLGGSLARDLRDKKLASHIVGVCRSPQTAKAALAENVVDQIALLEPAIKDTDLIVLATPMQVMVPLLTSIAPHISKSTIITDVGSVKTDLYTALKSAAPKLLEQFVLAHPIAGGENSGVAASSIGLFRNKHVIITDTEEVAQSMSDRIELMWTRLGARVLSMSLQEHDSIFAKTSHLPHVIAFSLVNYLSHQEDRERLFDLAAAGFYDFTRIASSDAEMWRDICVTNRVEVLKALDGYREQIDHIRTQVEEGDQASILRYFGGAKSARDAGLLKKAKALSKTTRRA